LDPKSNPEPSTGIHYPLSMTIRGSQEAGYAKCEKLEGMLLLVFLQDSPKLLRNNHRPLSCVAWFCSHAGLAAAQVALGKQVHKSSIHMFVGTLLVYRTYCLFLCKCHRRILGRNVCNRPNTIFGAMTDISNPPSLQLCDIASLMTDLEL